MPPLPTSHNPRQCSLTEHDANFAKEIRNELISGLAILCFFVGFVALNCYVRTPNINSTTQIVHVLID